MFAQGLWWRLLKVLAEREIGRLPDSSDWLKPPEPVATALPAQTDQQICHTLRILCTLLLPHLAAERADT